MGHIGPPGYPGPRGEPGLSHHKYNMPPSSHSLETGNRLQVSFSLGNQDLLKSQTDIHGWKPLDEKEDDPPFYTTYKVKIV